MCKAGELEKPLSAAWSFDKTKLLGMTKEKNATSEDSTKLAMCASPQWK
jgi:hypothetical protein